MMLKLQKKLAASVAGCSPKRIVFDPAKVEDIKEAITKTDIRLLIGDGTINVLPARGVSRGRANQIQLQKRRGLRRGAGSRKGKATARTPRKETWVKKIRAQRLFLKSLQEASIITHDIYRDLYSRAGGGYFRSINHIKIYMNEHSLTQKKKNVQQPTVQAGIENSAKEQKNMKKKTASAAPNELKKE
jgi:large subunit ribosomal protein L19e